MTPVKKHWLEHHMERLEEALAATIPGHEREWTECMNHLLTSMENSLRDRVAAPQGPNKLLATLNGLSPETPPTMTRRVSKLRQEQVDFLERVKELRMMVQNALKVFQGPAEPGEVVKPLPVVVGAAAVPHFGEIRQGGEELLVAFRQHQEAEIKLVQETANTDVGVGD